MTEPVAPAPGLHRAGARLPIDEYTRRLWQRRWFVVGYSTASNAVGYERSFLGQAWQLLTPVLNILVYYLIFGVILHTNRGIHNFVAFLAVGVFFFGFLTASLNSGTRSITTNLGLVRALQFPRAVLPLSTTLVALLRLLNSLLILLPIVLLTGEPLTWHWLEVVPVIAMQSLFCLGLAFFAARIGTRIPDMVQILPFVTRLWLYLSGVMFSVQSFTRSHPGVLTIILKYNPGGVYLSLARHALLIDNPVSRSTWVAGLAWAVVPLAMSYLYFWRGEEEYGNV